MIEEGVTIGPGTSIWDHVHVRARAKIGRHCIVGEKTYIAYQVHIGNYVKINAFVYIPTGITIEDRVMLSAGCIFVNDKYPRAFDYKKNALADSAPNEETLTTLVKEGATLGAHVTVLGNLSIGRCALVGAGSVVTKSVSDYQIVVGNPARPIGWICRCGHPLQIKKKCITVCSGCSGKYRLKRGLLEAV